jgi:CubicO group peptidase (beta-lactamase class C family)
MRRPASSSLVFLTAAGLALAAPAAAQTAFDAEAFDRYVADAVETWGAPGLAVAIVKDGEIVFERGYGVLELGRPEPVDEHTRFAIGSTTKAITAAAIGLLVDEGELRWDDRVIDHLPGFRLSDPYATRELTVRDLLTHRGGLGNADFLWYEQETTSDEIMERLALVEPAYSLRSGFIYQNIMYLAAGEVVEAASGLPWARFVEERILGPLGMDETIMLGSAAEGAPNVARPHDTIDGEVRPIENASVDPVAPAGSIWSSVHDMASWLRMLLAGGRLPGGEPLLSERTVVELFTPQVVLAPSAFYPTRRLTEPSWMTYGLAWFQHDYRGRKVDFHTGSIDGMVAIAGLVRGLDLGVYVLANRDHVELRHALMYRVFDLFDPHGSEPRDWSAELKALYDGIAEEARVAREDRLERREMGTSPSRPPADYAHVYADSLYGRVVVTNGAEGLRLTYGPGLAGSLEHWHHDTFLVRWDAAWRGETFVTFRLGADGAVRSLEMNGAELTRAPNP